jgi:hypothetical protein
VSIKKLRNQLKSLGINKAQADAGTCEGKPAVWLRWNGDEEVFTGVATDNPFDPMVSRIERFEDSKLN